MKEFRELLRGLKECDMSCVDDVMCVVDMYEMGELAELRVVVCDILSKYFGSEFVGWLNKLSDVNELREVLFGCVDVMGVMYECVCSEKCVTEIAHADVVERWFVDGGRFVCVVVKVGVLGMMRKLMGEYSECKNVYEFAELTRNLVMVVRCEYVVDRYVYKLSEMIGMSSLVECMCDMDMDECMRMCGCDEMDIVRKMYVLMAAIEDSVVDNMRCMRMFVDELDGVCASICVDVDKYSNVIRADMHMAAKRCMRNIGMWNDGYGDEIDEPYIFSTLDEDRYSFSQLLLFMLLALSQRGTAYYDTDIDVSDVMDGMVKDSVYSMLCGACAYFYICDDGSDRYECMRRFGDVYFGDVDVSSAVHPSAARVATYAAGGSSDCVSGYVCGVVRMLMCGMLDDECCENVKSCLCREAYENM